MKSGWNIKDTEVILAVYSASQKQGISLCHECCKRCKAPDNAIFISFNLKLQDIIKVPCGTFTYQVLEIINSSRLDCIVRILNNRLF